MSEPRFSLSWLKQQNKETQEQILSQFSEQELQYLWHDWNFLARDKQLIPDGDWRIWLLLAGRGFGKALALDTPIATKDGWTTMGEIKVGDMVFTSTGELTRVSYVSPIYLGNTCMNVAFSDGSQIVADANHEWVTEDRAERRFTARNPKAYYATTTRTTQKISETLYDGREINHAVRVANALQLEEKKLPIPPYVLGAWLGDGSPHDPRITCVDEEILERIVSEGYMLKRVAGSLLKAPTYSINEGYGVLRKKLRSLNVLKNKHIPIEYLRASYDQRLALLQGLMDTDGTASREGHCEYCSTNKQLASDFYELVCSMGIKATVKQSKSKLYGRIIGDRWRICFTPYIPVFHLERKAKRLHLEGSQSERQKRRYIISAEVVPSVAVRCIQVEHHSHLYLAGKSMIPTHNTATLTNWAIKKARTMPGSQGALIAATAADARDVLVYGESGIIAASPPWDKPHFSPTKRRIQWDNGSFALLFSADEPERLRGVQHYWAICDEYGSWRYPSSFEMLQFGLRLGDNPQVLVATTPKPLPHVRRLVDMVREGELNGKRTVRMTKGSTYENKDNLASSFIDYIVSRYENTRLGRQEIYAEMLEDAKGSLWKSEQFEYPGFRIGEDDPSEKRRIMRDMKRIVVGVDPGAKAAQDIEQMLSMEEFAETGIIVAGLHENGHLYIFDDYSLSATPEQWATRIKQAHLEYHSDRIVAERNNGGDMVAATIRTVLPEAPYKDVTATRGKLTRAEPIAALYEQHKVHHVGVFSELETQMTQWVPGDPRSKSPDRVDALVWACYELIGDTLEEPVVFRQGTFRF